MRAFAVAVVCSILVCCAFAGTNTNNYVQVGPWNWGFSRQVFSSIMYDVYYPGQVYNAADGWFYLYINRQSLTGGGVRYIDLKETSPDGAYKVFRRTSPRLYSGARVTTTFRLDDFGFATALWEFYNPGNDPITLDLYNYGYDNRGSGFSTVDYASSSGDTTFDSSDSWFISYSSGGGQPIDFGSFGEPNTLDYLQNGFRGFDGTFDATKWSKSLTIAPGEKQAFLEAFGVVNSNLPLALQYTLDEATNILTSATTFYNYITPSGHRLLGHLFADQLLAVTNWNFINAGVGGDPHGINFDGSVFELPNVPEMYCLYSDHSLQVNIRVGNYGFLREVVVFVRAHGLVFSARLENEHPVYSLEGRELNVPETMENGLFSTHLAPFNFKQSPLNQLDREQESSLLIRDMVTIVGGHHEILGGFFNVAVHRQSEETEFPSVLQLPFHPLRDAGFSASVISDVWFDLAQ